MINGVADAVPSARMQTILICSDPQHPQFARKTLLLGGRRFSLAERSGSIHVDELESFIPWCHRQEAEANFLWAAFSFRKGASLWICGRLFL